MSDDVNLESIKIIALEVENFKRVRAINILPDQNGLTILGGRNKQGKTSALDALCATLGGEAFVPANPIRDGAKKAVTTACLSNGIEVSRSYTEKGSYLRITDPSGRKVGQQLLNELIGPFALDVPSFINADDKKRATMLLNVVGVDLDPYEERIKSVYEEREIVGRELRLATAVADSKKYDSEVGTELKDSKTILTAMEDKIRINAKNNETRKNLAERKGQLQVQESRIALCREQCEELRRKLGEAERKLAEQESVKLRMEQDIAAAELNAESLQDQDVTSMQQAIEEVEQWNARVRKNLEVEAAFAKKEEKQHEYDSLTVKLQQARTALMELLNQVKWPLPQLAMDDARRLTYHGKAWDCMSHAEQLIVATSIVRKMNPKCGFVLLDKLEAMDDETITAFAEWLQKERLQAIGTRVGKESGPNTIIIEDGLIVEDDKLEL